MKRNQRVFGDLDALRFVDGTLDEERRAAYQAHLAHDADGLARVQLWRRQNDFIRAAFAVPPSDVVPLWLRLDHIEVDHETAAPSSAGPGTVARAKPVPPKRRPGAFRALASAIFLICTGAVAIVATHVALSAPRGDMDRAGPVTIAAPASGAVTRALDAFRTYAEDPIHPVEISSAEQPLLERWLMRRLMIPIHAPDLADLGWSLLGGRLAPGDGGPGAFLVYQNAARQRLALYIQHAVGHGAHSSTIANSDGLTTMSWSSDTIGYVLATGKDRPWMAQNGDMLRNRIASAEAD